MSVYDRALPWCCWGFGSYCNSESYNYRLAASYHKSICMCYFLGYHLLWGNLSDLYLELKYQSDSIFIIIIYCYYVYAEVSFNLWRFFNILLGCSNQTLKKLSRYHFIFHPKITFSRLVVHIHTDPYIQFN